MYAINIEVAVSTLKDAIDELRIISRISRKGNGFDRMSLEVIAIVFKTYFGKGNYQILICTGVTK